MQKWPMHTTLIFAEMRRPELTTDEEKYVKVDVRLDEYLHNRYGIETFDGSRYRCEPHGVNTLYAQTLFKTDIRWIDRHISEAISDINGKRDPTKVVNWKTHEYVPIAVAID